VNIKNKFINNIKNFRGWKSNRKLLAFAIDDYGNIRLSSPQAKEHLINKGVNLKGRFDHIDVLDTRQDYEHLFEVLQSFKDKSGISPVFTTYAMPANVDFQASVDRGEYVVENLDITYERLSQEDPTNYEGAFALLQKGIVQGLIRPQFHGREHLNVLAFNRLLQDRNHDIMINLELQCLAGVPNHPELPNIRFSEAFSFWDKSEIENHKLIIEDGLNRFEKVYGYRPTTFTPPAMLIHPELYPFLESLGIQAIDKPRMHEVHMGNGKYQKENNRLGLQKGQNHVTIVRNCMFEPNSRNIDWVNFTFDQIKAAFFWGKPAIVSSHRVNFCGHIDAQNRKKGLETLHALLQKVVKMWPEVEFVSIEELTQIIKDSSNN
jgi:hypothetical protein